jgi:flagellar biosynthesis protein FlhF
MNKVKRYFANTVEEGLALARAEFGEEALLVESRRTQPEDRRFGAYEVVVAAPPGEAEAAPAPPAASAGGADLAREITELRVELERMAGLLSHLAANALGARQAALAPVAAELAEAGVAPDLIQHVLRRIALPAPAEPSSSEALRAEAARELSRMFRCEARTGKPGAGRRVAALVGPPGAGKTTTLVKLAMRYGIGERLAAGIITTDTYRIAAAEQLKSYAAILGSPCLVADHAGALANALEEFQRKDLVLIDTPGFSPGEWDLAAEWARSLLTFPFIDVHLVLNAAVRPADLERLAGQWNIFAPGALVFTHTDEAGGLGGAVSAAARSGLPVSYLCGGQAVPEDLEPATPEALLGFLRTPRAARRAAA